MTKKSKTGHDRSSISTIRNMRAIKPAEQSGQYELLVILNNVVSTYPLPINGEVTIGRARESDVQIIDPSVSRRHARLSVNSSLKIKDLGSANGTSLKGKTIPVGEELELLLGEVVELGSAMLMIQRRPVSTREWRIWAHGYFQDRLENECARALRSSSSFGLLRVRCGKHSSGETIQQVLVSILRSDDVVGLYGPGEYEILVIERTIDQVNEIADQLFSTLTESGVDSKIGIACFPNDGSTAHTLEAKAGLQTRLDGELEQISDSRTVIKSPAMIKLYDFITRIAASDIAILVLGETGVGKEVVAEAIHNRSPRSNKPFLRLNCAALSESLLESELFGHEKGAFTGAHQTKKGLLETAHGGTVFLDEIGDLPPQIQVKLLRVLEDRQVWRVGSVSSRTIDVRFLAATHRDLEQAIVTGSFRQDLFFRLNGVSLHIPPLRQRKEEIEELSYEFIRRAQRSYSKSKAPTLTKEALSLLLQYSWPGNVRELQNAIERAVLLQEDGKILSTHLPVEKISATVSTPIDSSYKRGSSKPPKAINNPIAETINPPPSNSNTNLSLADMLKQQVQSVERQHIVDALNRCGGNQTRAAKELGISRRTLISRLEVYGIPRPMKNQKSD